MPRSRPSEDLDEDSLSTSRSSAGDGTLSQRVGSTIHHRLPPRAGHESRATPQTAASGPALGAAMAQTEPKPTSNARRRHQPPGLARRFARQAEPVFGARPAKTAPPRVPRDKARLPGKPHLHWAQQAREQNGRDVPAIPGHSTPISRTAEAADQDRPPRRDRTAAVVKGRSGPFATWAGFRTPMRECGIQA